MKNKRPAGKRLVRWLATAITSVFAVLVLLLFLLTLSPGEKIIKGIAESKLRDLLEQEVQIGKLETNLLSRLQMQDLEIFRVHAGDTVSFLSLPYARARYSLMDLLFRGLSIDSLNLDGLILSLKKDSSGSYNLPLLDSAEKTGGTRDFLLIPLPLPFRELKLGNGEIKYADESTPQMSVSISGLTLVVEAKGEEGYHYRVSVDSTIAEYQGLPVAATQLALEGLISRHELRLDSISVHLPDLRLMGSGAAFPLYDSTFIRAALSLRGNPSRLVQAVRKRLPDKIPPIDGDLDLTVRAQGTLEHPKLDVRVSFPVLDISQTQVRDILVRAELEPDSVRLTQLSLQVFGGTISAQGKFSTNNLPDYRLSLSAEAVDLAKVWKYLYQEGSPYQGRVRAQLSASGQSQDPREWDISAKAHLNHIKYYSKFLPDVSAELSFRQGLAHFRFHQQDSEIFGQVKLGDQHLQGEFSANIPQIGPLAGLANLSELTGNLWLQGVVGGNLDSPEIEAEIKAKDIAYQNFPMDSLVATFTYRGGRAYLGKLSFEGSADPIDTLHPPFHLSNIGGGIAYRGYASGPADSPAGEVTVNLIRPSFGDIRLDEGLLKIVLDGPRIDISPLQLRRDSLLIQVTGVFHLPSANGTCEIQLVQVPSQQYNLGDNLSDFVPEAEESRPDVRRAGKLTAAFALAEANQLSLQVNGEQLDLEKMRSLFPETLDVGGLLEFDLDFSGNLDKPHAGIDFHLEKPRFQLVETDSITGHFILDNDQFQLQRLELHDRGHYLRATATVGLERTTSGGYFISDNSLLQGRVQGSDFDLRLLNPLLNEEMRFVGRASYDFSWDGTLANFHPVGTLDVHDARVETGPGAPPIERLNLTFSVEDSVLHIEEVNGVIRETPFHLEGRITASQWQRFNLQTDLAISNFGSITANGTISQDSMDFDARIKQMDLSLLQPFFPDLTQLSGTLNTELALSGSTTDPQLDGHLEISNLTVQPSWLNAPLSEGIIKLDFNQRDVKVDSFFMRLNEGTILFSGSLTHDRGEVESANLQANISNLKINRPKEMILAVKSARLSYKNQNNYFLLDGDIVLDETRLLANFRPQSILPLAQAVERPKQELPPFLQQTRLNVRLRESENIWVDNNLARLRLHTELGIVGSPVQPNLTGRVAVEEGYVLYIDRKFKISQGVVDFIDPDRLNPIIDFKAQTRVTSYRATEPTPYVITLAITGPLDEVVVELASEPPLDKSNIVSLLTLGATRDQLSGKDAEGKDASISAVLKERAQSISSQRIAGYTSQKVGGLLGLDQFTIEGNLFNFDRSWGPQLLASKKISPRMEITYTTTVGHSNENRFRLDYWLSKHFSLEGETDQQGRAGMNLKYRLRYK
jgi:autotransporter translocation and assembly factor TamB